MFGRFRRSDSGNRPEDAAPLDAYQYERDQMVHSQLIPRKITDRRVLDAMLDVPRHAFVPESSRGHAYEDRPLDIGAGQTISQPFMVAAMTQMLATRPEDRVLEIGTGSGYQTAVLATLVQHVTTVERVPALARHALETLMALEYQNVSVKTGDGTLGWPEDAPYDAIIVTAAGPAIPEALKSQLADGGRLVCPVGSRDLQHLVRVVRLGDSFREEESVGCVFVPLIGEQGWPD